MPPKSPFEKLSILSLALIDALDRGSAEEAIELLHYRGEEIARLQSLAIVATEAEMDDLAVIDREIQGHLMVARQDILRQMTHLSKQKSTSNAYRKPPYAQTLHSA